MGLQQHEQNQEESKFEGPVAESQSIGGMERSFLDIIEDGGQLGHTDEKKGQR